MSGLHKAVFALLLVFGLLLEFLLSVFLNDRVKLSFLLLNLGRVHYFFFVYVRIFSKWLFSPFLFFIVVQTCPPFVYLLLIVSVYHSWLWIFVLVLGYIFISLVKLLIFILAFLYNNEFIKLIRQIIIKIISLIIKTL